MSSVSQFFIESELNITIIINVDFKTSVQLLKSSSDSFILDFKDWENDLKIDLLSKFVKE